MWLLLLLLLLLLAEHRLPFPGLQHELIPFFENTYRVLIKVKPDTEGMLLYLYGLREERAFTMVLIVSLACKLYIKRNRGK